MFLFSISVDIFLGNSQSCPKKINPLKNIVGQTNLTIASWPIEYGPWLCKDTWSLQMDS